MAERLNADRPIVRVTDNDTLAAMQILACIARPQNPARAGELMQQWLWARKRHRGEGVPHDLAIPVPDKDRINTKFPALAKDIDAAIQAGEWFKMKWAAESDGVIVRAFGRSLRQQGARQWNQAHKAAIDKGDLGATASRENEAASAKQRIWNRRRPVVHMAAAVRNHVLDITAKRTLELEELVFHPIWVAEALERAESYAEVAIRHGILDPGESWHFQR
jgi:hypothetical protein